MKIRIYAAIATLSWAFASPSVLATASADEAAKLGGELTPVGATKAGNGDGSIPAWTGPANFSEDKKKLTRAQLEEMRNGRPGEFEAFLNTPAGEPLFVITKANMDKYADKLTVGQKAMLERYADYKIKVYKTLRPAFYPDAIYAATKANATRASLEGTDAVHNAELGFPFPIPKSGAEIIWNHKMKFRGSAVRRYNNQAIVAADGSFIISKLIENVKLKYANLKEPGKSENKLLLMYVAEFLSPPRVAGQLTLVHETADQSSGGRNAWIYNPSQGRTLRAPQVGYDNPSNGSDGEQFNDQVDVFNGALDRYDWKLVGKKEMVIPYNSYSINSPRYKYKDIIQAHHINQDLAHYELHRAWIVDATLKPGIRHNLKRRTFYVDEDSWSVAAVDGYDARDQLWKIQEAHLATYPFIPTTTGTPELIYDLQSGRYFVTALSNEDAISDFEVQYDDKDFSPANIKLMATKK